MFWCVKGGSRIYSLYADHLGSTSVTANEAGILTSALMYKAWGETRLNTGDAPTDYGYTGQRNEGAIGLYFYNARWYDPSLGRFIQADSMVPNPGNPMDWDRYAYVRNNPVNYTDPSGHMVAPDTRENGCSGQGPACIMDMYYSESGDSEGLHDSVEAYIRRNPDYDPTQDQELTGTAPIIVAAAKTRVGIENGSFRDYVAFGAMAGFGTYLTGYAPYELATGQNGKLSSQQRDFWGDPDCIGCGYQNVVQFPTNSGQTKHIFRDAPGHFADDTAMNRSLMVDTVQNRYYMETDIYGTQIYARLLDDGAEIWVYVRDGVIRNGGLNQAPRYTK